VETDFPEGYPVDLFVPWFVLGHSVLLPIQPRHGSAVKKDHLVSMRIKNLPHCVKGMTSHSSFQLLIPIGKTARKTKHSALQDQNMDALLLENLKSLFNPTTVAVIGASDKPDKLGFHVMKSLKFGNFRGAILLVNPGVRRAMGIGALPSIMEYQGSIELAIIVLPSKSVPRVFEECISKGIKGIVLITAGFKEIEDPKGAELQGKLAKMADEAHIPVIGPNTFGMINLHQSLNASFTPEFSMLHEGGDFPGESEPRHVPSLGIQKDDKPGAL
jgi:predicted CoA-binding protein